VALVVIEPPHHPQVRAASLRGGVVSPPDGIGTEAVAADAAVLDGGSFGRALTVAGWFR